MNTVGAENLLMFFVVIVLIPMCLWLLKRAQQASAPSNALMRSVAVLPISPSQKIITIEVGSGDERRWLVLGVTPQQITSLHSMPPQDDSMTQRPLGTPGENFNQLIGKLMGKRPGAGQ